MRLCVRGVTLCALDVLRPLGPGLVLALVLVLAHSASTTPSEPGVMPAGVLLCNVLPLRLLLLPLPLCALLPLMGPAPVLALGLL